MLEEEIRELEALQEVHEQLIESNHELEMDLREELDMAQAAKREVFLSKYFPKIDDYSFHQKCYKTVDYFVYLYRCNVKKTLQSKRFLIGTKRF